MSKRLCPLLALSCLSWLAVLPAKAQMAIPDEPCRVAPFEKWNEQERWAWDRVCTGQVADLAKRPGAAAAAGDTWPADRVLTPEFVKTLLFVEPYRSAVPNEGIIIKHAVFEKTFEIDNGKLRAELRLEDSRFKGDVLMNDVATPDAVSLNRSEIAGDVVGESMRVGVLELRNTTIGQQLSIGGAKIDGYLELYGTRVNCDVWADLIDVKGHVYLNHGNFGRIVRMRNSRIGFSVQLFGAQLNRLDLSNSIMQGELNFGYDKKVNAASWVARDGRDPILVLRNTSTSSLVGWQDGWPTLRLGGFSYGQVKIDAAANDDFNLKDWGLNWLAHDRPMPPEQAGDEQPAAAAGTACRKKPQWVQPVYEFNFQPYRQFAATIANMGMTSQANDVLYAGRERERAQATGYKYFEMTVANYLIGYGYGYRYFFALAWAFLLVLIGRLAIYLSRENERRKHDVHLGTLFCIDLLLPLIQFRRRHFDVEFDSQALGYYFIFHRIAGFILGSFILAGMAGLTK